MNKKRVIYFAVTAILFLAASCAGFFLGGVPATKDTDFSVTGGVPTTTSVAPEPDQKDLEIDDSVVIVFPKLSLENNEYFFVKEKDQTDYTVQFASEKGSFRSNLDYIGSLGTWRDWNGDGAQDLSSTFLVYKLNADILRSKIPGSLPDWIKKLQEGMGQGVEVPLLASVQSWNETLLRNREYGKDSELVYFHVPEPSDNGWYAYRYKNEIYFFSMGNNSEAVKGSKAGLWDKTMLTLRSKEEPYKISGKEFKATLGEANKVEMFSVPSDTEIASYCPACEDRDVDLINGQTWEFALSNDHKHYAYMAYKDGKDFVVLDGAAQKQYDGVYFLKFSPDGKYFSYHAYDESRKQTFLVLNGKEISVYPGGEGYPQAANGVSEAYSNDGQFVYARVTEAKQDEIEVYRNGKLINTVQGYLIGFWFSQDNKHVEYTVLGKDKSRYYVDNVLKDDDYNSDIPGNKIVLQGKEVITDYQSKGVYINGTKLADYSDRDPEVYITSLLGSPSGADVAYKVWVNEVPGWQKVSLNGNDSNEVFNDIKDIKFSDDGKTLSYIGRVGRSVYFVTQSVLFKD